MLGHFIVLVLSLSSVFLCLVLLKGDWRER